MIVNPRLGDILQGPKRTYYDFYHKLSDFGWEILEYSPHSEWFDSKATIKDLEKELKLDIIVSWDYAAVRDCGPLGCPKNIPYVVYAGDYEAIPSHKRAWYPRFDLIIQRGPYKTKESVETVWLPLSVDDDFYDDGRERIKKIIFLGNTTGRVYVKRREALSLLKSLPFCEIRKTSNKGIPPVSPNEYPTELRKYVGGFTCTGWDGLEQPLAKHFEYGASGTAVLTSPFKYSKRLFGKEQCYFEYDSDRTNLIRTATELIEDTDKRDEYRKRMLKQIDTKHRDTHRLKELDTILRACLNGKPIPKKWGF